MASFVECLLKSGEPVVINLDRVSYMQPRGDFTRLHFEGEDMASVRETPPEIVGKNPMTR